MLSTLFYIVFPPPHHLRQSSTTAGFFLTNGKSHLLTFSSCFLVSLPTWLCRIGTKVRGKNDHECELSATQHNSMDCLCPYSSLWSEFLVQYDYSHWIQLYYFQWRTRHISIFIGMLSNKVLRSGLSKSSKTRDLTMSKTVRKLERNSQSLLNGPATEAFEAQRRFKRQRIDSEVPRNTSFGFDDIFSSLVEEPFPVIEWKFEDSVQRNAELPKLPATYFSAIGWRTKLGVQFYSTFFSTSISGSSRSVIYIILISLRNTCTYDIPFAMRIWPGSPLMDDRLMNINTEEFRCLNSLYIIFFTFKNVFSFASLYDYIEWLLSSWITLRKTIRRVPYQWVCRTGNKNNCQGRAQLIKDQHDGKRFCLWLGQT